MPRVNVPVTSITRAGVADTTPTTGDATNGHSVANTGDVWVEVENTGASSRTLTALIPGTVDGQAVASKTWSLGAGVRRRIGPFPIKHYTTTLQLDVTHAELELSAYRVAV